MLLTAGIPGWPGAVQKGSQERPWPSPPAPGPISSDTGYSQPRHSEFPRLKTAAAWLAPATEWPSLTPSALLSCPAGTQVLGEDHLLHPGNRDWTKATMYPLQFPRERTGWLPSLCQISQESTVLVATPPLQPYLSRTTTGSLPACRLHPYFSGDSLRERRATWAS